MKSITKYLHFLSLVIILCLSCAREEQDSYSQYVQLDKTSVSFPSEGGRDSIINQTGKWLHIRGASERALVDGEWQIVYPNIYEAEEGLVTLSDDQCFLDGKWFHLSIPESPESHKLIIEVGRNDTGQSRRLLVGLRIFDFFPSITVEQE